MSGLVTHALEYAARGWSIIPIGKEKKPVIRSWKPYQEKPAGADQLQEWFGNGRASDGLAVVLGSVSGGVVCRDFDTMESYARWAAGHPDLAASLPTVATGRGRHVYFRANVTQIRKMRDGELRGAGYCLLPPSIHPSGMAYRWLVPLPHGPLPAIDPAEAGLLEREAGTETERAERTEKTEDNRDNRAIRNVSVSSDHSVNSVLSADSVLSVSSVDVKAFVATAVRETMPQAVGERNRKLFEFARWLKAQPALADAPAGAMREYVRAWHTAALPNIGTKPFDETWADFVTAWPKVKFPKGTEPMAKILKAADAAPNPVLAHEYDDPRTYRLIRLCRELQRNVGDQPFFLSCRTVADVIGLDVATSWRRLKVLLAEGVLATAEPGTKNRATRFRYVAEQKTSATT